MARPSSDDAAHVKQVMDLFNVTEAVACKMLEFAGGAYDQGVTDGQAKAQRYLRLLAGIETPTAHEAVYWSAPFPLKKGG